MSIHPKRQNSKRELFNFEAIKFDEENTYSPSVTGSVMFYLFHLDEKGQKKIRFHFDSGQSFYC